MFQPQQKIVPVSDTRSDEYIGWACDGDDVAKGKARAGILAHNSVLASRRAGKKIVYKDDCDDKPTS